VAAQNLLAKMPHVIAAALGEAVGWCMDVVSGVTGRPKAQVSFLLCTWRISRMHTIIVQHICTSEHTNICISFSRSLCFFPLSLYLSSLSVISSSPVWFCKWDSLASDAIVVGSECPHCAVLFLNHNPPKRPMSLKRHHIK